METITSDGTGFDKPDCWAQIAVGSDVREVAAAFKEQGCRCLRATTFEGLGVIVVEGWRIESPNAGPAEPALTYAA